MLKSPDRAAVPCDGIARPCICPRACLWLVLLVRVCSAGAGEPADQWPSYGRDHNEQRFSPLDAVNTHNIGKLGLQWWVDLTRETALVATPLIVDGTLFFSGKFGVVYAVSARAGTPRWTYDPRFIEVLDRSAPCLTSDMGIKPVVGWWADKVFVEAPDLRASLLSADPLLLQEVVQKGLLSAAGMPRYVDLTPADVDSIYHLHPTGGA